jgi:hypothetical protein
MENRFYLLYLRSLSAPLSKVYFYKTIKKPKKFLVFYCIKKANLLCKRFAPYIG